MMKTDRSHYFVRAIMMLFLMTLTTVSALADGLTGSGTMNDPWLINSEYDWNVFSGSSTYWASGTFVRLCNNITISSGAGRSDNRYQGTFDGVGHTLTLNLTHTGGGDAFIAPFKFVHGAIIKRLHIIGTINTDGTMAGGIVGDSRGTSTIQNCRSSVTISSSVSNDGTHGGLAGRVDDGELTIADCLFDGIITYTGSDQSKTHSCGGFVGWKSDNALLKINNSLQAGDFSGISSVGGATFCRYNSGSVDFSDCYYRTAYGTGDGSKSDQGTQTSATGSDLQVLLGSGWEVNGTDVVPIMSLNPKDLADAKISGVKTHYKNTGNDITVTPTVKVAADNILEEGTHYTVAISPYPVQNLGSYTLTVTAKDNNTDGYFGSISMQFEVWPWADDAIDGGYCGNPAENDGKNVYYEITGSGSEMTLTIYGTGAMADFESSFPWSTRRNIKYAVVNDGVTTIGRYAFYYCGDLTSITIPASVTSIGDSAFYYCNNLATVTFNDGSQLTTIGNSAFYDCHKLASITIPASVTSIGKFAFEDCDLVESVTIGSGLTSLGPGAFNDCDALTSITVDENNTAFMAIDNVLYSKDRKTLVTYPKGLTDTDYIIPDNVTTICSYAFYCCQALESVTIPASVTSIGDYAFYYCQALKSITIPAIPASVTSIGDYAFGYCSDLATITILASVTSIGDYAFEGTAWIDSQADEDGVLYINDVVVASKADVVNVTIKDGTTAIAGGAFSNRNNLTSITIPASVTSIGNEAFYWCYELGSITFEENSQLTTIGDFAFGGCEVLESITIPASVTSISDGAFVECQGLNSITFEENSQLTTIGDFAFGGCGVLESITIPASVTSIGDGAFYYCNSLMTITIPSSVTIIGYGAFYECQGLNSITFDANSQLKIIGDKAFYDCDNLHSITIPAGVTSIGSGAFFNCEYLTTVTFNDGLQLTVIGDSAFCYCINLQSITIPVGLTSIGNGAFYDCGNLQSITIPAGVTSIGDGAFSGCFELMAVTFSDGSQLTVIGDSAFYHCDNLQSITIPAGMTSIGDDAFGGCFKLNTVIVLAATPPTLGSNAFSGFNNNAVFAVRDSAYVTADGWTDIKEHTGDYSYAGCNFAMIVPDAGSFDIAYIDTNGQAAVCPLAFPIAGRDSDAEFNYSGDVWYYVSGDVTINGCLYFYENGGSVNLILCDDAKLTVKTIYAVKNLNIFVQSNRSGAVFISNNDYDGAGILVGGDITINGGTITINATGDNSYGILAKSITINGGKVYANGSQSGMFSDNGNITLGYSNFGDYIYANSYYYDVSIKAGQTITYYNGAGYAIVSGNAIDGSNLAGKYLFPAVSEITLKANSDYAGNYWATFYCGHTSFTADGSTTVYKGAVSYDKVQLTQVEDIPAGNAVILKSTSPVITLTKASTTSADFEGNDLEGADIETDASGMQYAYCLAKSQSGAVGFYRYSGNGVYEIIPANRAYLLISSGSNGAHIRRFLGFEENSGEVTKTDDLISAFSEGNEVWFDLQGRKVEAPTKGLFIVNGKKVFIN